MMYGGLTVLGRFPYRFNYPWPITRSSARSQYGFALELVAAIKASVMYPFAYIVWVRLETAMGTRQGLRAWFLPAVMSVTGLILILYIVRARRPTLDSTR